MIGSPIALEEETDPLSLDDSVDEILRESDLEKTSMENGTACGDDIHHSSLVDTNLILPESGRVGSNVVEKLSVLWSTSARSDTMKNYRAYRSKLLMGKHSRLKHYGLAVIACAVAVALAGPLDAPSSCFSLAIIASSLFGGTGPGLLAVGLSAVAFNFLFLPSPLSLSSPSSHYLRFGVFVVTAFATSQLVETKNRIEESRRRIEEDLSSTQRRLSRATQIATVAELAASIAHEVSQPLSAVVANGRACIQWLSAEPADLANAKVAAERIIRDGKAAGEVVRHMRALFKKTALERIALNVNEVIEEVLSLIHDETVRKQIVVETDLEKSLPTTLGDRVQLQQVIFNLLLNGVEAMETVTDRPKKLIVRSRMQSSDAILVEIRDYGTGVADSTKVFEAFYTTKEKGMGMGLSICSSIVEAHGGQLGISPSQGSGTTFFFTLPLGTSQLE